MQIGEVFRSLPCATNLVEKERKFGVFPGNRQCQDARVDESLPELVGQELPRLADDQARLLQICRGCLVFLYALKRAGLKISDIPEADIIK